jgi:hypothetical protein
VVGVMVVVILLMVSWVVKVVEVVVGGLWDIVGGDSLWCCG